METDDRLPPAWRGPDGTPHYKEFRVWMQLVEERLQALENLSNHLARRISFKGDSPK